MIKHNIYSSADGCCFVIVPISVKKLRYSTALIWSISNFMRFLLYVFILTFFLLHFSLLQFSPVMYESPDIRAFAWHAKVLSPAVSPICFFSSENCRWQNILFAVEKLSDVKPTPFHFSPNVYSFHILFLTIRPSVLFPFLHSFFLSFFPSSLPLQASIHPSRLSVHPTTQPGKAY